MSLGAQEFPQDHTPDKDVHLVAVPDVATYQENPVDIIIAAFRSIHSDKSSERAGQLQRVRRESIGRILAHTGVVEPEAVTSDEFTNRVTQADKAGQELRGQELTALADKFDEHPFTEIVDDLQRQLRATQYGAEVILMRRAGLVLLSEYSTEQ